MIKKLIRINFILTIGIIVFGCERVCGDSHSELGTGEASIIASGNEAGTDAEVNDGQMDSAANGTSVLSDSGVTSESGLMDVVDTGVPETSGGIVPAIDAGQPDGQSQCSDVLVFPDPELEELVRINVGILDGSITLSNTARLDTINMYDGIDNIVDLTGIECLTSLTRLELSGNNIINITPLKSLDQLIYLDLRDNRINDVTALASLVSLGKLYLDGNAITDLTPLASIDSLLTLYLANNEIIDIAPLKSLTSLIYLDLSSNNIRNIDPLVVLDSLVELNLRNNSIENIDPLVDLDSLNFLDLRDNSITCDSAESTLLDLEDQIAEFYSNCSN